MDILTRVFWNYCCEETDILYGKVFIFSVKKTDEGQL
jgi:hypothetical protein